MGLKTQVKVFEGTFDQKAYNKLDKTDAVAVIGQKDAVEKSIATYNAADAKRLKDGDFGNGDADDSQNPRHHPGGGPDDNIIAINAPGVEETAEYTQSSKEEAAAFLIDHGAGHLSDLNHAGDDNGRDEHGNYSYDYNIYVPTGPNVMSAGTDLQYRHIALSKYITTPVNQQAAGVTNGTHTLSIKAAYIERFGNNNPTPTLPTQ
jgi:hypothetical protein